MEVNPNRVAHKMRIQDIHIREVKLKARQLVELGAQHRAALAVNAVEAVPGGCGAHLHELALGGKDGLVDVALGGGEDAGGGESSGWGLLGGVGE